MNKSEKFWDELSNNFDKRNKRYKQTYIKIIEKTKKYLNLSDTVFDYACGTGTTTIEMANCVNVIHATDISSGMIHVAQMKTKRRNINNIYFAHTTIFDEKFEKESFDVILAFNILHLLEDNQKVVKRINELLKPEGLFISSTVCLGEKKTFFNIIISLLIKIGIIPYMNFFKIPELEDLMTNGNFQITETEKIDHASLNYYIVAKK